jgi:hypothetical protein
LVHLSIFVRKLRKSYSTEFIADDPFIQTFGFIPCPRLPQQFAPISLTTMAACQNFSNLALSPGLGLIARDNRLITRAEFEQGSTNRAGRPAHPASGRIATGLFAW